MGRTSLWRMLVLIAVLGSMLAGTVRAVEEDDEEEQRPTLRKQLEHAIDAETEVAPNAPASAEEGETTRRRPRFVRREEQKQNQKTTSAAKETAAPAASSEPASTKGAEPPVSSAETQRAAREAATKEADALDGLSPEREAQPFDGKRAMSVKPAAATENKPAAATENKPAAATENKPTAATENKPTAATENKPAAATENKPAATENKPAATESKPAAATENKPAAATENKSAATENKSAATESKPATATENKPAAATENKPAAATEGKPAVSPENKPAAEAAGVKPGAGSKPAAKDEKPALAGNAQAAPVLGSTVVALLPAAGQPDEVKGQAAPSALSSIAAGQAKASAPATLPSAVTELPSAPAQGMDLLAGYVVHVGSYAEFDSAAAVYLTMINRGYLVRQERIMIKGKPYYRLFMGPFKDQAMASEVMVELARELKIQATLAHGEGKKR